MEKKLHSKSYETLSQEKSLPAFIVLVISEKTIVIASVQPVKLDNREDSHQRSHNPSLPIGFEKLVSDLLNLIILLEIHILDTGIIARKSKWTKLHV
jgi:hypothetical protein